MSVTAVGAGSATLTATANVSYTAGIGNTVAANVKQAGS